MINRRKAFFVASSISLAIGLETIQAQDASPNASPATSGQTTQLGEVVVTGARIPIEESIVPTVRPQNSSYGLDLPVMQTPRNVTIISRQQLDDTSINDVRDFTKLTTSSYTQSNFGAPSNPSIRGQTADVFLNGMRLGLTSNGNGLPLDFNAVESVDIFKGPPSVVQGASAYVGGSINLNTKQPFFDKFQGSVSATFGTYDQYRWNVDIGGPIIADKLAFRISYSGVDSGSYYENQLTQSHSIYAALTWIPTPNYKLELSVSAYFATYTENFGINRPTQNLIDNGQYFAGNIQGFNGVGADYGSLVHSGSNIIIPTGQIGISGSRRLFTPGNGSYGKQFHGQAIQTITLSDNATIVNNTLFQYIDRHTESYYYYDEYINPALSIENRTELHLNFETPFGGSEGETTGYQKDGKTPIIAKKEPFVLGSQINLGIDIKYQEVTAYDDYFDEPANAWNLAIGRQYIKYRNFTNIPGVFSTHLPLPNLGRAGGGTPGILNSDTNNSRLLDVAPFYEHVLKFGDYFSLLAGARLDILWVNEMDPLYNAGGFSGGGNKAHAVEFLPNVNISPTFTPTKWLTAYFTYNYSQSIAAGNGGGLPSDIPIPNQADYHRPSQLFEFGAKATLLEDTLFVSAALFQQDRVIPGLGSSFNNAIVRGFEIEADYQPSRNFYVNVGYSYLDARVHGSPFVSQPFPVTDPRQWVDPTNISKGVLTDNGTTLPNKNYREPGLPTHAFNLLMSYKIPTKLGTFSAILGNTVTGPMDLGYGGYIRIPWQYEMDLTFAYKTPDDRFEAKLALLNLTDQKNWNPPNPVYSYDSVVQQWPFHIEGTITFKF